MKKRKSIWTVCLLILLIPALILSASVLFAQKYYALISLLVAVLACIPLFYAFERRESTATELAVLAVLIALCVLGRFLFAWLPGFKPVTALTIIAAVMLGREAGFVVGALSAVVSNFYFGQGPWTPFQMFAWGLIGFCAGVLRGPLKKHRGLLLCFGAISGVLYSMTMDVWTTLWAHGSFHLARYAAYALSALPVTVEYAVSNVIFLWLLARPIGEKLARIQTKYGLFLT